MASFDFPLQFKRQFAAPLDLHSQLTTAERTTWLTDGRRYAGQIVFDTNNFKTYSLNSAGNNWLEIPVSSSSSEIQLTFGLLTVDQIRLNNNTVTTAGTNNLIINTNEGTNSSSITVNQGVNGNIIFALNGTGDVGIGTTTPNELLTVAGNLSASGNISAVGNLSVDGNTTIGNATGDTVTFNARINTNFIPSTDNTRDLGSSTLEFKDLWIDGVANIDALSADAVNIDGGTIDGVAIGEADVATILKVDNIQVDSNTISSTNANGNILITPNNDGDLILDGQKWPRAIGSITQILTVSDSVNGQLAWQSIGSGGGGVGDVSFSSGLGTPLDNAVVKFDNTTGKLIQKTDVIISDTNNVTGINNLTVNGTISGGSFATGTTDNVITQSTGTLQTRSINSRVWNTNSTFLSGAPTNNTILRLTSLNTIGNSNITQDAGNRIGIGTSAPSTGHLLTVIGGISGTNLDIDNIDIDGNTISSTNTNGNIIITPNAAGSIVLDGQNWPQAIGSIGQVLGVGSGNQLIYQNQQETIFAYSSATEPPIVYGDSPFLSGMAGSRSLFTLQANSLYRVQFDIGYRFSNGSEESSLNYPNVVLSGDNISSSFGSLPGYFQLLGQTHSGTNELRKSTSALFGILSTGPAPLNAIIALSSANNGCFVVEVFSGAAIFLTRLQ